MAGNVLGLGSISAYLLIIYLEHSKFSPKTRVNVIKSSLCEKCACNMHVTRIQQPVTCKQVDACFMHVS